MIIDELEPARLMGLHESQGRRGYSIQTFSRRHFWPCDPSADEVSIEDIAHALANICRFGGHSRSHYSVAQHSVLVSRLCWPADTLWGLLHDAAEAYVGDLVRPLKRDLQLVAFEHIEANVQWAICKHFRLPSEMPASVKRADQIALATEFRDVMGGAISFVPLPPAGDDIIQPWGPIAAKRLFLERFVELGGAA